MRVIVFFLALCLFVSSPVYAEEATSSYKERMALASEMHKIKPARDQVEGAIDQVSVRLPQSDRALFKKEIMAEIDFDKLEELSIKSMAEIFSVEELQAMVGYFGTPEAKSISEKMPVYEEMMQPQVGKMLDAALMRVRAGK